MINGIELIIPHQTEKVRKLHGNDAVIGKENFEAADEIVQRRNMSENVIAENEIGLAGFRHQLVRRLRRKKRHPGVDTLGLRCTRDIARWFDSKNRNALLDEILQKIAVIAGDLDDKTLCIQTESSRHKLGVAARVIEPAVRV